MALILNIETSASVCSVALSHGGEIAGYRESSGDKQHAGSLAIFIRDILLEKQLCVQDLDAVAVSSGPGSYTGLRIGVSTAKGLCYGAKIPLIGIPTLPAMADGFRQAFSPGGDPFFLVPLMDARRMEVYTSVFDASLEPLLPVSAQVITSDAFASFLERGKTYFFGEGASKCSEVIIHPNACFVPGFVNSARFMCRLSEIAFEEVRFEDVAYFEPFYLKDFMATKPKNKILGGLG